MRAPGTPFHGRDPSPADDRPDSHPISPSLPYPVPLHWQDAVKADLDRDVHLGVLEQVPIGNPVTWCHQMVICAGKKWHTEAHHRFSAPQCPSNKGDSPHPVPIPPSPFRPPRQTENRVRRLEWVPQRRPAPRRSSLHDIHQPVGPLQVQNSPPGLHIFWRWLYQKIRRNRIRCPAKNQVCRRHSSVGGHHRRELPPGMQLAHPLRPTRHHSEPIEIPVCIPQRGIRGLRNHCRPCQKFTRAIKDFPTPKNLTDVRSWFGLVNQVAYAFSMTTTMLPFRDLLKPSQPFRWDEGLQHAFEESKLTILKEISHGVQIFDKSKPTSLATDWSKTDRVLAVPETLPVPLPGLVLLPHWMAHHPRWQPIYPRSREQVCPSGRRGTRSG